MTVIQMSDRELTRLSVIIEADGWSAQGGHAAKDGYAVDRSSACPFRKRLSAVIRVPLLTFVRERALVAL